MAHVYAKLSELKAYLTGGDYGTAQDAGLVLVLESASQAVDSFCRRGPGFAAELADLVAAATLDADLTDSATTVSVADVGAIEVGQTIRIGDEDLLVLAVDEDLDTLTVLRAQNETDAAAHSNGAAVSTYRYPSAVVDATIRVAQRRWKMRDAGLTGAFGGSAEIPQTTNQDTEMSILRATLGHLRFQVVA